MPIWNRIGNIVAGRKDPNTGRRTGGLAGAFRDADGNFTTPQQALISNIGRRIEQGSVNRNIARDNRDSDARRQEMINAESGRTPTKAPPVLGRPMPGPVDIPNPRDGSVGLNDSARLTPQEIAQQQAQFDQYKDDPRSVYYQGPRAGDPIPGQIEGPNAHTFRNPTRELYDASQARTGSGQGFKDAVEYYRSIQKPNRNIQQ